VGQAKANRTSSLPADPASVELRRRACRLRGVDEPYDIPLDDFSPYTSTAEVREIFDELGPSCAADRRAPGSKWTTRSGRNFPRQERVAKEVVEPSVFARHWRLDPTASIRIGRRGGRRRIT
jgi:hypothetical protein